MACRGSHSQVHQLSYGSHPQRVVKLVRILTYSEHYKMNHDDKTIDKHR